MIICRFFDPVPTQLAEPQYGLLPDSEDSILWVDNTSAIATAKPTKFKPKSRHYA